MSAKLTEAQRKFLVLAVRRNGVRWLSDESFMAHNAEARTGASAWWRTAESLARRGMVERVYDRNGLCSAFSVTDAGRVALKGES